ncbi:MAG: hypothetical protein M3R24_02910 [Chloroflexota bacterium]|nr:hypothetical protein [Chloroflexota bacterium]
MAMDLQQLISQAETLSPQEQMELIHAISHFLRRRSQQPLPATDFWQPKSVPQLIQAQAVQPVQDIAHLPSDEAADNEPADEMIAYIYGQRQADRLRTA